MNNLNKFLQPNDSIPASDPKTLPAWKFGVQQDLQGRQLRYSHVNIDNFIATGTVASGSFQLTNNHSVNLSIFYQYSPPHQGEPTFTIQHVAIYLGTAVNGSMQIYPGLGGSISTGSYVAWGGYDFQNFDGTHSSFTASLSNISGATGTFSYRVQKQFIYFNSGVLK